MSAAAEVGAMEERAVEVTMAIAAAGLELRLRIVEALKNTPAQQKAGLEIIEENCAADDLDELIASVERLRPNILMLALPGLPGNAFDALARIAKLDPAPRVVVVNDCAEPETILKAMRAGAAEFVYPPFESAFGEAITRATAECIRVSPVTRSEGSVIGFVSAKGGCGATTLACHAAAHLRRATGKEVLLADMDVCSGIVGLLMQTVARYSLDEALQNLHRMDLKLWKALVSTTPSGVDVIPASPQPAGIVVPVSRKLPQMLRFWRLQYDFTILDLGHGLTQPLVDVLDCIDALVLTTTPELPALRQARQMIQAVAVRNLGANRLKLVINRMPKRATIQIPDLEKVMGHAVHSALPNDYRAVNDAYSEPRLVGPDTDIGTGIAALTDKLASLAPAVKKSRGLFAFRQAK